MEEKPPKTAIILGPINKEGGVTTFIEELTPIFINKGYLVHIVTLTKEEKGSQLITASSSNIKVFYLPKDIYHFLAFIHKHQSIEIIISNLYYSAILPFIESKNKIHILHGFGKMETGLLRFIVGNLSNILGYKFANRAIANSYLTSSINRIFGIRKSEVIPWGIPSNFQEVTTAKYQHRDIDLLYVGRLHAVKGIELIVKSFSQVFNNTNNKIYLHIVGDLGESIEFRQKFNQYSIQRNLVIHGYMDKKEIVDIYSRSKLFISLNPDEPLGFTYLESLSCGTPVILPKGCGVAPFLNSSMALFVDMNETSVVEAIEHGLCKSWNYEHIANMARNIFNWQNTASVMFSE